MGSTVVYREDFLGETAFPTTPEVDLIGLGSFESATVGDPPPLVPTPDGVAGLVDLTVAGQGGTGIQQVIVGSPTGASFGSSQIGVSGRFSGFDPTYIGAGSAGMGIVLSDGVINAIGMLVDGSQGLMQLGVFESNSGGFINQRTLQLSFEQRAAILAGAAFDLDLWVDVDQGVAVATLDMGGSSVLATPMIGLNALAGDFYGIAAFTQMLDVVGGADDVLAVNLHELSATVPEPSTALLIAMGLGCLAAQRRGLQGKREPGTAPS
jgi:hypothetical protein